MKNVSVVPPSLSFGLRPGQVFSVLFPCLAQGSPFPTLCAPGFSVSVLLGVLTRCWRVCVGISHQSSHTLRVPGHQGGVEPAGRWGLSCSRGCPPQGPQGQGALVKAIPEAGLGPSGISFGSFFISI